MASSKLEFLAKAKEAEEQAKKARDSEAKVVWLRVAESYRQLAELAKN